MIRGPIRDDMLKKLLVSPSSFRKVRKMVSFKWEATVGGSDKQKDELFDKG